MISEEPWVDPDELRRANERHDLELSRMGIDPRVHFKEGFRPHLAILRGPLTDKKISQYSKLGFYSDEFREFRRKNMQKKAARKGNFLERDGRQIYCPL